MSKLPLQSDVKETAGFLGNMVRQACLAWHLLTDSRVPAWIKLIPVGAVVYLISPIDLIPDFLFPGVGELDDLAVLLLSVKALVDLSPPEVVRQHLDQIIGRRRTREGGEPPAPGPTIDVPYRVIGSEDDGTRDK
jgi:uncharacterized membrane protein YkvA (DUF1232 family)